MVSIMTSSTDTHFMQVETERTRLYKEIRVTRNSQPKISVIKKLIYKGSTYSVSSVLATLDSGDTVIDASLLGVFSLDLSSLAAVLLPAALAGDWEEAGESLPIEEDDDEAIFAFLL